MSDKPEFSFKAGAVEATVWKNHKDQDGVLKEWYSIAFQRNYKDKEGNWKKTSSLPVQDIPKAMVVLGKAYEQLSLN